MTKFEKMWLVVFSTIILATTIIFSITGTAWNDWKSVTLNWVISPVSAITGVVCVVLCARGDIKNWVWGFVNSVTYGLVAWVSGYYGDWLLNWFFFIPTQFLIFYVWKSNLANKEKGIVKMMRLDMAKKVLFSIIGITSIIVFAYFLTHVNTFFFTSMARNSAFYAAITAYTGISFLGPLMDSASVILQVSAEIMLIFFFAEQWPLWIATNVIAIAIWSIVAISDPKSYSYSIPTLVMWIAFLVNSAYGTYVWYTSSKEVS